MKPVLRSGKKQEGGSRGFTMVELAIAVALGSLMIYGVTSVGRIGNSQAQVVGAKTTMQESARRGLASMLQEIRESSPSRIALTAEELSFAVPASLNADGTINWSNDVVYSLGGTGGTQLIRTGPDGNVRVLVNNVQAVTFTADDPAEPRLITVRVDLARDMNNGRSYTESMTAEAKIRNE